MTLAFWSSIVWSGETKIASAWPEKSVMYVWQEKGEAFNPKNTIPSVKHMGLGASCCGVFFWKKGPVHVFSPGVCYVWSQLYRNNNVLDGVHSYKLVICLAARTTVGAAVLDKSRIQLCCCITLNKDTSLNSSSITSTTDAARSACRLMFWGLQ